MWLEHLTRLLAVLSSVLVIVCMFRLVKDHQLPSLPQSRGFIYGWMITILSVSISIGQHFNHGLSVGIIGLIVGNLITLATICKLFRFNWQPKTIRGSRNSKK